MGPIGPLSIRRLYARHLVSEAAAREVGWEEAERLFPECSPAWERESGGQSVDVASLLVLPIGPAPGTLVAIPEGAGPSVWYIDGTWRPHSVQVDRSGAYIRLTGPGGKMYVPILRTSHGRIEVAGPAPESIPGSHAPDRPNGRVSAVIPRESVGSDTLESALSAIDDASNAPASGPRRRPGVTEAGETHVTRVVTILDYERARATRLAGLAGAHIALHDDGASEEVDATVTGSREAVARFMEAMGF